MHKGPEAGDKGDDVGSASLNASDTPAVSGDSDLQPGERLDGYEIQRVLGTGGMAVVYAATQLSLKREVALKVPLRHWICDERFMLRFRHESEALAGLNHPNIVNIIDRGHRGEVPYFVMEYVDGISLESAISRGTLRYGDYLVIIRQVRDALTYIHSNGIVHLDLKPANILLGRNGRVKVSDFGIAAMAWDSVVGIREGENSLLGTPRFMAPEQLQRAAILDARTDVYALGVTFHLMLCGSFPEGGQSQVSGANSGMPRTVDPVLGKAMALAPSLRFATVEQFSNDLLESLVGTSALDQIDSLIGNSTFNLDRESDSPASVRLDISDGMEFGELELEVVESGETGGGTADNAFDLPGEPMELAGAGSGAGVDPSRRFRGTTLWAIGFPMAMAATAVVGAIWWPAANDPDSKLSAKGGTENAPPPLAVVLAQSATSAPAAEAGQVPLLPGPWVTGDALSLPRFSYSFMAIAADGTLALATFNNRSLNSLPEDLPVILVRNPQGPSPEAFEVCSNSFASQRGYSGLAFGEDGALYVSADTGLGEDSFVARYTPAGGLDSAFGEKGYFLPQVRCHGIAVANGHLYISVESGEVLIVDGVTGRQLGRLPKAAGAGMIRDLALDPESGRVFGVRSGGLVVWEPKGAMGEEWSSYRFRELQKTDGSLPRALEGISYCKAARRVLYFPDRSAETVECDGASGKISRFQIGKLPPGAVFVDSVMAADGQTLFVSDVAKMQVRVMKRQ